MTSVRKLESGEALVFHELRLRGLEESPEAFASTLDEETALADEAVVARFPSGEDRFVLGAFDDGGRLVGVLGFSRETHPKLAHWGTGWGMYVAPEARGHGVGRALVEALVDACRALDGLEQIVLAVATVAESARSLYLSCGFQSFGLQRQAMKRGETYYDVEHLARRVDGRPLEETHATDLCREPHRR